ncbi:DNA, complete sequence [Bacillus sp. GeD10]|nr:DNA, complete sequence [Bacillus sp. GeD10]
MEQDANGRMAPRKVGTKPVQKDELEYEFMLNFVIDIDHVATTSKDNTQLFEGNPQKITADVGRKLYQWLELGLDVKAEEEAKRTSLVQQVMAIAHEHVEAQKKIQEFEWKANLKLEDFTIKLLETALDRLEVFKMKEEK